LLSRKFGEPIFIGSGNKKRSAADEIDGQMEPAEPGGDHLKGFGLPSQYSYIIPAI
jgi:hypothetical protein